MGQQFFFFHSDRLHFVMLASIQDDVPKELSLGGVNQCMRGKDGRKGSKRTSRSEKNPTVGYLLTLSVRVVNAVTDSFPRPRNRNNVCPPGMYPEAKGRWRQTSGHATLPPSFRSRSLPLRRSLLSALRRCYRNVARSARPPWGGSQPVRRA